MDAKQIWPIVPKKLEITDELKENIYPDGVIPRTYTIGFLTELANTIKQVVAIRDFVPEWEMIDCPFFDRKPYCEILRGICGNNYCWNSDKIHADLFIDVNRDNGYNLLNEKIKSDEYNKKLKEKDFIKTTASIEKKKENFFLQYNCPILGCKEILFPIYYKDCIIAVLIAGEIVVDKEIELIKNTANNWINKHQYDYLELISKCKDIIQKIEKNAISTTELNNVIEVAVQTGISESMIAL
jgi:hypothetical protein